MGQIKTAVGVKPTAVTLLLTSTSSLGSWNSAIELHPHLCFQAVLLPDDIIAQLGKNRKSYFIDHTFPSILFRFYYQVNVADYRLSS
ncbi:MAG: hypothetical protein LBI19_07310 [Oscillospiraceae bacterium]|nr:hypothetical protein [Oscillospiraceae bacterium]